MQMIRVDTESFANGEEVRLQFGVGRMSAFVYLTVEQAAVLRDQIAAVLDDRYDYEDSGLHYVGNYDEED